MHEYIILHDNKKKQLKSYNFILVKRLYKFWVNLTFYLRKIKNISYQEQNIKCNINER